MQSATNHQHRNIGVRISRIFIPVTLSACMLLGGPAAATGVAALATFFFKSLIVSTVIGVAIGAFVESMTSSNYQLRHFHHTRNTAQVPSLSPRSTTPWFVNMFHRTSNPGSRTNRTTHIHHTGNIAHTPSSSSRPTTSWFVNMFQRTSNPVPRTNRTTHTHISSNLTTTTLPRTTSVTKKTTETAHTIGEPSKTVTFSARPPHSTTRHIVKDGESSSNRRTIHRKTTRTVKKN